MQEFLIVYLPGILIVGALLMMLVFGAMKAGPRLRGQGKLAIAAFVLPLLIFAIIYLVNAGNDDQFEIAMIMTAVVMIVSGLAALVIAGVRGLVK